MTPIDLKYSLVIFCSRKSLYLLWYVYLVHSTNCYEAIHQNPNKPENLCHISDHHNTPPLPTSVLVILVPYCCVFCVLSNDMLNISIGTFT